MTANIGAEVIKGQTTLGFRRVTVDASYEAMKNLLMKEVERQFRPEFLNRLDDVIVFRSLTREDLRDIVKIEMSRISERMADRGIKITLTPEAAEFLIDQGYNPDFGARPLRRALEKFLEDPLSEQVLRGEFKSVKEVTIKVKEGHLYFESQQEETPSQVKKE
jgi:ATP-dependent Clp protease ATP-binding subunit ClpC